MSWKRSAAALLALLTILSPMLAAVAVLPTAGQVSAPEGMVNVPAENVQDARSAVSRDSLDADTLRVAATKHARTTEVSIVTQDQARAMNARALNVTQIAGEKVCHRRGGEAPSIRGQAGSDRAQGGQSGLFSCTADNSDRSTALVISDDSHSEGRSVAIRTAPVEGSLGYVPEMVTVRNQETGETWRSPVETEDGWMIARIEHFSTNTVSFSSTFNYTATPISDGGSFEYNISALDSADNFDVSFTGSTATASETDSASGFDPGGSMSISPAGNLDPTGPSNNNPELSVTGHQESYTEYSSGSNTGDINIYGSGSTHSEHRFDDPPGTITEIDIDYAGDTAPDGTIDIRIAEETPDENYTDGTKVLDGYSPTGSGTETIDITDYSPSSTPITLQFVSQGGFSNVADTESSGKGDTYYTWDNSVGSPTSDQSAAEITLKGEWPSSVGVSSNGANGATASLGSISDGQTKTTGLNVAVDATSLNFNGNGGTIDATLTYTERTQTVDPTIEVNGNTKAHTGSLSDGSSATIATDTSWLQEGTNKVNVTVGDGTLSGDAPTPQVDLDYQHDITGNQSVEVTDEVWTERYNISKTYEADRTAANLTVPFQSNIYHISELKYRENESGGWSTVSTGQYGLSGTDVEIDVNGVYGGPIPATTTVEFKVNGSKVNADGGTITVDTPTKAGADLDSGITLDTWGSGAHIEVNRTAQSKEIHYAAQESWSGSDEYAVIQSSGDQELYLPAASAGSSFQVRTLPIKAKPETNGDVKVQVDTVDNSEPVWSVEPGPGGSGDSVDYTFVDAIGSQYYELWSQTDSNVRDAGTASSPLTLSDDDSEETLRFREGIQGSGADSGGGGGGGGGGVAQAVKEPVDRNWPLIIAAIVAGLALLALVQMRTGINPISTAGNGVRDLGAVLAGHPRALAALLLVGGSVAIFTGMVVVPESILVVVVVAAIAALSYLGLQRTDSFTFSAWGVIVGVSAFAALMATGQLTALFDTLGTSGSAIAILGMLFIAYRAIQQVGSTPNTVNRLVFRGSGGEE